MSDCHNPLSTSLRWKRDPGWLSTSENTSAAYVAAGSARAPGPSHWITAITVFTGCSTTTPLLSASRGPGGIGSATNGSAAHGQSPRYLRAMSNTFAASTSPVTISAVLLGT